MKHIILVAASAAALLGTAAWASAQSGGAPAAAADSTRLFALPTGRTLPAGRGYVDAIGLGVVQFQVALGDWMSVGGGTPSIIVGGGRPVWLTPKVALARGGRVHAAAGAIHYFAPGSSGGAAYGVVTAGGRDISVTLGALQGYGGDLDARARLLWLGLERRHSKHTRILMEAEVFSGGGLVIAGMRRVHKRFTSDFGMAVPLGAGGPLLAFPVVSFGWRF